MCYVAASLAGHDSPDPLPATPPTAVDGHVMPSKADAAGCLAVMDLLAMHLCATAESMSRCKECVGEVGMVRPHKWGRCVGLLGHVRCSGGRGTYRADSPRASLQV